MDETKGWAETLISCEESLALARESSVAYWHIRGMGWPAPQLIALGWLTLLC